MAAATTTGRSRRCARVKRVTAVGLAFDEQEVDAVPGLDYDERLDWVLTPRLGRDGATEARCVCCFSGMSLDAPGRKAVTEKLPELRRRYKLDFVVVNGENAAGGFGITEAIFEELLEAGADAVTLGNHAFDQKEALVFIERQPRLLRPLNYPPGTPGRARACSRTADGRDVLVINALGRVFMSEMDDPFRAIEHEVTACALKRGADAIVVDFHAEATSEKQAMAFFPRRPRELRGGNPHPCADG